jgi:hypothetical protein
MSRRVLGLVTTVGLLAGCSTPGAVFVTKTSLSIVDADTTPAAVTFGFDRVEGFIGPLNPDGSVPSVVAKIETDGHVFNSKIKQIYATGDAADAIAGVPGPPDTFTPDMPDPKRLAFFGTSTSVALKVGFASTRMPNTFVLGYRRKELSAIPSLPLVTSTSGKGAHYVYPPLLASIDTGASAEGENNAGLGVCQSFASGAAATQLAAAARDGNVRLCSMEPAKELFGEYRASMAHQTETYARLMRCYSGVTDADRDAIWADAARHGLFASETETDASKAQQANDDALATLRSAEQAAAGKPDAAAQTNGRRAVDATYAGTVLNNNSGQTTGGKLVGSAARERLLEIHKDEVCRRARLNSLPAPANTQP